MVLSYVGRQDSTLYDNSSKMSTSISSVALHDLWIWLESLIVFNQNLISTGERMCIFLRLPLQKHNPWLGGTRYIHAYTCIWPKISQTWRKGPQLCSIPYATVRLPPFTKKTPCYGYRNPHYKLETVRQSQVYTGNPYTYKTVSS